MIDCQKKKKSFKVANAHVATHCDENQWVLNDDDGQLNQSWVFTEVVSNSLSLTRAHKWAKSS